MQEIWRAVVGYEGSYEVSNLGNVRALPRTITRIDGIEITYDKPHVTIRQNADGYMIVRLSKNGVRKQFNVHRLVAEAFIPNMDNLPEVNHIDANRANNCVDNLEWCTHRDNVRYAIQLGNHYCTRNILGENNPNYRNDTLKKKYAANPELAQQLLSRPGCQNGRSTPIDAILPTGEQLHFDWIGGCAQWLLDNNYTHATVNAVRTNITNSIKKNKKYLGLTFIH